MGKQRSVVVCLPAVSKTRECVCVCLQLLITQLNVCMNLFHLWGVFADVLQSHLSSHLADALRRAGHGVVHAVVLADGPPQLGVRAVLLQRVGAFVPEVVVDRRVPHRAVVHVDLPRQVLERPGRHDTPCFTFSFYFFTCILTFTHSALHLFPPPGSIKSFWFWCSVSNFLSISV